LIKRLFSRAGEDGEVAGNAEIATLKSTDMQRKNINAEKTKAINKSNYHM